jgi:hypothetical protein
MKNDSTKTSTFTPARRHQIQCILKSREQSTNQRNNCGHFRIHPEIGNAVSKILHSHHTRTPYPSYIPRLHCHHRGPKPFIKIHHLHLLQPLFKHPPKSPCQKEIPLQFGLDDGDDEWHREDTPHSGPI